VSKAYTLTPQNVIGLLSFIGDVALSTALGPPPQGLDYNEASESTWGLLLFQQLSRLNPDAILGLMAKFRADAFAGKVDLGVGVFRDLTGNTPILDCVRRAEQTVLASQSTKSYVGAAGREEFNSAVEELVLGPSHSARRERRAGTVQAPGGCGALRVGAELIRAAAPSATVYVSDPTWGNHAPLLGSSGLPLERYPYYDAATHELRFDAMLERLDRAAPGDVVLIHACCHNPSGADLGQAQWQTLIELLQRRRLVPFLDLAYQGFGDDLTADVAGVRLVAEKLPEVLIATSYSKNLGLYRERVGALIVISENESRAEAVRSHVLQIARSIYSMPPDHGAAIAACIFADSNLRESWIAELAGMRTRIKDMRALLARHLRMATGDDSFDFIQVQRGMFSLLGVSAAVVDRLRDQHHIYMTSDSRMNLAGIMPHNVAYVAQAIAAERTVPA
jgi:aspartate/tyrosine/aromatic aminotransferase